MSKTILLNPDGAWLVAKMLGSCGSDTCDEVVARLRLTRAQTALRAFADEKGNWLKPVFNSLQAYAMEHDFSALGVREIARYFGGTAHIDGMVYKAVQSNLGMLLGLSAGLVLDVLLPLSGDGHYRNGDWDLDLGQQVWANPDAEGVPCAHRGLVVNLPLLPDDVAAILAEQRQSKEFGGAIVKLEGRIFYPPEYLEALRLTCT